MINWKNVAGPMFVLMMFFGALYLLHNELNQYHLSDFTDALKSIPPVDLLIAIGLTALNYVVLMAYDWVGVRYIGHPMPFKRVALASFLGCAVGNNFGSLLGGSGIRYRLYSNWGLSATDIVKLVLLLSITFWVGLFGISGLVMLIDPAPIPDRLNLPFSSSRPLGILLSVVTVVYLFASIAQKKLTFGKHEFSPPPINLAAIQYLITALDLVIAAAVLFVLLPDAFQISFWHFFGTFLLAVVLAIVSTVPGGLGVFELTVIVLLDGTDSHELVGALLAFRIIYYLIPLAIGLLLMAGNEIAVNKHHLKGAMTFTRKWSGLVAPSFLGVTVFMAGIILLISGATPSIDSRMDLLRRTLPLPAIEVSHFVGSIIGVLLLVLARGLQRRIETAWYLSVALLVGGIIASLIKGFDWEEATILSVMMIA